MARQSFFAVYILFRTEEEAVAWEATLPSRPEVEEGGEAPWESSVATAIRDDFGGYYEGSFRKVTGRDGDTIATIIRAVPDRCYEPRKDGFVWPEMAAIAKGKPETFATAHVKPVEETGDAVGVLGGGGGGGEY